MSNDEITDEKLQSIIDKQQINDYFPQLCLPKEELTILGWYLNGKRYKKYLKSICFSTNSVQNLWREIQNSKFTISEDRLKLACEKDFYGSDLDMLIRASKKLAKNITEDECSSLIDKVEKMYFVTDLCEAMYYNIESETEQENFKYQVSILADSKRIETLSLEKIKAILTSYNGNKYNKVIEKSNKLSKGLTEFLEHKAVEQDRGIELPFPLLDRAINGLRKGQLLANGMMSNDGKTRLMIRLASNLALKQNKKILIISNEMTEEEIKYCFITSIINNKEFKEMFGNIDITKTEREIRNGIYSNADELEQVKQITSYLEEKFMDNITVIHTTDYSAEDLKDIILTHYIKNGIDYFFYDTLKADIDSMSNWDGLKAIATVLSELAKEYNISIWSNIQLVNRPNPIEANVDNIANSKQLYHVLDILLLFVPIPKNEYDRYVYWNSSDNPNNETIQKLDSSKKYYTCVISKNRSGAKRNLLFEVNLDQNTWEELGQVAYYNEVKRFLV